jgi:nucleotide-binding universal stress UspA family protein
MAYRDILAVVTNRETDASVLSYSEALARANDAHLSAVLVNWIPSLPVVVEGWVVDTRWGELVEEARNGLERERVKLEHYLAGALPRSSAHGLLLELGAARSAIATYARHADLTVLPRPQAGGEGRNVLLEGVLFGSGRPVILVPPKWTSAAIADTVLVAWNAGREAARALADALPMMKSGARVIVTTVDAKPSYEGHGDLPGADIAAHLARHDLEVELRNVPSGGRPASTALFEVGLAEKADLIVMGGYGRSRMSEFVFGGVTRDMMLNADIPVLMSH